MRAHLDARIMCDVFLWAGKSAEIHYGTGAISGYFSEDSVEVGDLVVKKQVKFVPVIYYPNTVDIFF